MKYTFLFFLFLSMTSFSQEKDMLFFEFIQATAAPLVNQISRADIEVFKNQTPQDKTWTYANLKKYRDALEAGNQKINKFRFIMPSSTHENLYQYCEYALTSIDGNDHYYYVVGISVDTHNDSFDIESTYLFTEEESLKVWWRSIFGFFKNEPSKLVPNKYLVPGMPPPPQGFLERGN